MQDNVSRDRTHVRHSPLRAFQVSHERQQPPGRVGQATELPVSGLLAEVAAFLQVRRRKALQRHARVLVRAEGVYADGLAG